MKVWVETSELWPCYRVTDVETYAFRENIEIPEEDYARYRHVIAEFFKVQHEIAKFFPED
ncbi:MAG TPA: hypothetical protein VIY48_14320 [Candidatus Paceibacterota bacterium]